MSTMSSTLPVDTLFIRRLRLRGVDYDQEFVHDSIPEDVSAAPDAHADTEWLKHFLDSLDNPPIRAFCIALLVVTAVLAIWFLVRRKFVSTAERLIVPEGEDTIYGVDFAADIAQAEQRSDYYQCIRLRYLQLLRLLQDEHCIDWQPGKTVSQYTTEVTYAPFSDITRLFVRIRYGNYPASAALYAEAQTLAEAVGQWVTDRHKGRKEAAR